MERARRGTRVGRSSRWRVGASVDWAACAGVEAALCGRRSRLSKSSPGWGGPSAEHTSCSIFRLCGGDGHSLASARYGRQEVRRRRAAAVSATSPQESSRRRGPAAATGGPPISTREGDTAIDDWAARGRAGGRAGSHSGVRTLPCRELRSNAVGESRQISLICGLSYRRAWLASGTTGSGEPPSHRHQRCAERLRSQLVARLSGIARRRRAPRARRSRLPGRPR